ncbi:MAG: type II secretion system F family protein [Candidatus Dojkabacteria bacterium]
MKIDKTAPKKKKKLTFASKVKRVLTTPIGGLTKEKELFIQNLSMLITSGLDVITALKATQFDIRSRRMRELTDQITADVNAGSPMWKAFEENNLLPSYMVALVRIGEETGKLPENLIIIVEQQQKTRLFKSKIISAMIYPAIIFGLSIFIGIGIFVFVLPRLSNVYNALGIDLPFITKVMIFTGTFLRDYGIIVLPLAGLLIAIVFYFLFVRERSKHVGQRMIFSIPALRGIVRNIEIARFGFMFSTLLEAGLPILDAISSLGRSTGYYNYSKFYRHLERMIEEGYTFQQAFKRFKKIEKIFPVPIQQIVIAAENSGRLMKSSSQIGTSFEEKIDSSSKNLAVVLEPLMLIIVWLGVVFVALSVIFPVYNLVGGVGQSNGNGSVSSPVVDFNKAGTLTVVSDQEQVNVYKDPADESPVESTIESGITLRFTATKDGWVKIVIDETTQDTGWIQEELVQIIVDLSE